MSVAKTERFGAHSIHAAGTCSGHCPFHAPSEHHMTSWPIVIRETTLVERLCPHGIGHPDPDSVRYLANHGPKGSRGSRGVHGCDGCCDPRKGAH